MDEYALAIPPHPFIFLYLFANDWIWKPEGQRKAWRGCVTCHWVIPAAWGHITATGSLTLCAYACVCPDQIVYSSCRSLTLMASCCCVTERAWDERTGESSPFGRYDKTRPTKCHEGKDGVYACVRVCVCGKAPSLGVVYGLVAAAFLRSAASEQHIPEEEGKKKRRDSE